MVSFCKLSNQARKKKLVVLIWALICESVGQNITVRDWTIVFQVPCQKLDAPP